MGVPAEAGSVESTTTAADLVVSKTHVGLLTSPNTHNIAPGADDQDNLADQTSCTAEPGGVLRRSQGGLRRESGEEVSRQGTTMPSLMSTNPPLTYSSAVTGVPERCYRGKSADSKWFAPEIKGSVAQIRSKVTINDKRRGTSRPEPQDNPSRQLPSRATRVTQRITVTPLPGTAPAAGKSPQQTARCPDVPPHMPQADIRSFQSGRPSPRTCTPLCTSKSDTFLLTIVIDTLPSAMSAPAPTLHEPAAPTNPRLGSKGRQSSRSKRDKTQNAECNTHHFHRLGRG